MPVTTCPRCRHVNPDYAVFCHFDGVVLQAQQSVAVLRLPREFKFPSGRRCNTFDELAQGCQEEWASARNLLMRDEFANFFRLCKRDDLVRAANDAKAQTNPDIALMTFLESLPGIRTQTPKVDLNPRRIILGKVSVGETRTVPLTITNQGQGLLQGTISVTAGQEWLSLSDAKPVHELEVSTPREQTLKLTITPRGVPAGQNHVARLTVVTNGGVVEVPLGMELVAQPFAKAPFQGARAQRELAEKMHKQPKMAAPILESGEVQRWFTLNGWPYPIHGAPIKGLGAVAQFFEGLGVSTPPSVELSKKELRLVCRYRETARAEVILRTNSRKWVYANLSSDSPWLKLPNTQVAGPKKVPILIEIDTNQWNLGPKGEGTLTVEANGGKKLTLKVIVEVQGAPPATRPSTPVTPPTPISTSTTPVSYQPPPATKPVPPAPATKPVPPVPTPISAGPPPATPAPSPAIKPGPPPPPTPAPSIEAPSPVESTGELKYVPAFATIVLVCLILRLLMVPVVDLFGRTSVGTSAADKLLGAEAESNGEYGHLGGWLQLPWLPILASSDNDAKLPADVFRSGSKAQISRAEFGHYFISYFIRWFLLRTWWIGAIIGALLVWRQGGSTPDLPWGVVAGAAAGFAVAATIAAFFLVVELVPHLLWHLMIGPHGGVGYLFLWVAFAVASWLIVGVGLGAVVPLIAPLRWLVVDPLQRLLAGGFTLCGMTAQGEYWSPD